MRYNAHKYTYVSQDGDEGFPGAVEAKAWWTAWEEHGKTIVEVEYEVEMLPEQPKGVEQTVVALTNHRYVENEASRSLPSIWTASHLIC